MIFCTWGDDDAISLIESLAIWLWVVGSLAITPGAISGAMESAKMSIMAVATKNITIPRLIILLESSQALSNLSWERYWEKTGIKASAIVPNMKTSKMASGKT